MLMEKQSYIMRKATEQDDGAIAQHLHHIMLELGLVAQSIQPESFVAEANSLRRLSDSIEPIPPLYHGQRYPAR